MLRSNLTSYIKHTPSNFNQSVFDSLLNTYLSNITQFYELSNLNKVDDYLYEIEYSDIDYAAGAEYCKRFNPQLGACSSVYKNGLHGRNYDWYYDNSVSFVVHTSDTGGRHKSVGVAAVSGLTKEVVETLSWDDFYAVLPNLMLDGINDAGFSCNINVVPSGDLGHTTGTNKEKESLCTFQIVRYLLDNADSVDNAISLLNEKNWWAPNSKEFNYELHAMLCDSEKSCVVEFVNNEIKVIEDATAMTNFYLYGVEFNEDGSVYTPATQTETENAIVTNHITPFGSGLERYNLINSSLSSVEDADDMADLMHSLYYSNTYTANPDDNSWYTEVVGARGLTVTSSVEEYQPIFEIAYEMFENRSRNVKNTWQTVHSSVYDLANKTVKVWSQESEDGFSSSLEED